MTSNEFLQDNGLKPIDSDLIKSEIQHLSFSSLKLYQQCPFKWYLRYICDIDIYENNLAFEIGSIFHKALETLYMTKDVQKGLDILLKYYGQRNNILIENYKYYCEFYYSDYVNKVQSLEEVFKMQMPKIPIPITGRIDMRTYLGIVDFKTTSKKENEFDKDQLVLYHMYYKNKYGYAPQITEFHFFSKIIKSNVGIKAEKVEIEDELNLVKQFQEFYQNIMNCRFVPSLASWKKEESYSNVAKNYRNVAKNYLISCIYE